MHHPKHASDFEEAVSPAATAFHIPSPWQLVSDTRATQTAITGAAGMDADAVRHGDSCAYSGFKNLVKIAG